MRHVRSGSSGLYAVVAALLGTGVWQWSDKLWVPAAGLTFDLVRLVLYPLLPTLSADTATRVLATDQFEVEVSDVCSGLEGMGLILAFSVAWLVYFRREYVFPRALLLIPVGLAAMFALNVFRIAALMLIGNAGYPDVASFGFHSQAGWIAFNSVACGLVFVSRRSSWLNRVARTPPSVGDRESHRSLPDAFAGHTSRRRSVACHVGQLRDFLPAAVDRRRHHALAIST